MPQIAGPGGRKHRLALFAACDCVRVSRPRFAFAACMRVRGYSGRGAWAAVIFGPGNFRRVCSWRHTRIGRKRGARLAGGGGYPRAPSRVRRLRPAKRGFFGPLCMVILLGFGSPPQGRKRIFYIARPIVIMGFKPKIYIHFSQFAKTGYGLRAGFKGSFMYR